MSEAALRASVIDALGVVSLRVTGSCLEPVLRDGDHVQLEAGAPARFGDLVLVETVHGPRLHRLVGSFGGRVLTSPDHGPCDPPSPRTALLAVAPGHRSRPRGLRALAQGIVGALRR